MAVWWGYISSRGSGRGGDWSTDEQRFSDKSLLIHLEKLHGHSKRFCVKEMKEKYGTFCFI